ncbi:MAG: hypothetical protein K2G67_07890 [Muribaculaceae bacterium]|nr:hypothetical protein [Muribaculaceae bacterium]
MIRFRLFCILTFCVLCVSVGFAEDSIPVAKPDGKYIYVPDSLENDVIRLLGGHSKVVDDVNRLDPDEKTIYKGDTVNMVLKSINLGRFDRGLSNFLFIPKGTWQVGLTASYGEIGTKDLDIFGLLSDIDISAYAFSIKPYIQYFLRNNMAIGLRLGYYNARGDIESLDVSAIEDMNFSLNDVMYRAETYSAAVTFTQFLGLSRRGRFGIFNEIEASFQGGHNEFRRPYGGNLRTTETSIFEAQLNFSPGVQVFVLKNVATHVSFGVFGFYFKNEKQKEEEVETGSRFSSGANFRFNIFNINFGIAATF